MFLHLLFVAIGGFFGSVLRFFISNLCQKHFIGTWIANVSGAILLAYLLHLHAKSGLGDIAFYMGTVGFCGAYTTFSTFGKEVIELILDKRVVTAVSYVATSFIIPFLIVLFIL